MISLLFLFIIMDGWIGGWMDGWMDKQTDRQSSLYLVNVICRIVKLQFLDFKK